MVGRQIVGTLVRGRCARLSKKVKVKNKEIRDIDINLKFFVFRKEYTNFFILI